MARFTCPAELAAARIDVLVVAERLGRRDLEQAPTALVDYISAGGRALILGQDETSGWLPEAVIPNESWGQ